ncbi:branched chain amino acid aminotransferase, partial [bacterium DOLZORAL124_64_63]
MTIKITRNPNPRPVPTGDFGFGSIFTPHMFIMEYKNGA